jgi:diacylglycerol O-acyltransferase / wax synthase
MHIGAALVFDALPDGATPTIWEVRKHLDQRLDLLPRYRQKLNAPHTGGLAWPSWEADHRFELAAHVRHAKLPSPADEREFLDWISDFSSHRLDRSRPLREIVLLDGLADGPGRWCGTHHRLVDGVGSVGIVDLLLDSEREPARAPLRASAALRRGPARTASPSAQACRPGGRRGHRCRSRRRPRADPSA